MSRRLRPRAMTVFFGPCNDRLFVGACYFGVSVVNYWKNNA